VSLSESEFRRKLLIGLHHVDVVSAGSLGAVEVSVQARLVCLGYLQIEGYLHVTVVDLDIAVVRVHTETTLVFWEWC
jgi:ABC-type phosphonate transport system ATPase subunit